VAPPEVTYRLFLAKRSSDLSTNSIAQIILAKYLEEGLYSKHLHHVRDCYRRRRDAMIQALSTSTGNIHFDGSPSLTWSTPQGGLFIWAKLPTGLSSRELLRFAEPEGVTFSPGDTFFLNADHCEYMRLCFIQTDEAAINKGIERLAIAMRRYFDSIKHVNASAHDAKTRAQQNVLI
jgi:2-aminoadipate transaminase